MDAIACPGCGKQYPFKPEFAGKKVKCRCGVSFDVALPNPVPELPVADPLADLAAIESSAVARPRAAPAAAEAPASDPALSAVSGDANLHQDTYIHERCGAATQMSEDIVRCCVADPYYFSSGTVCVQCGQAKEKDCYFVETGERMNDWVRRCRARKGTPYHVFRWLQMPIGGVIGAVIVYLMAPDMPYIWLIGLIGGLIGGWGFGREIRLRLCLTGKL